jgi:uncharacterized protein (DUF362 family)
MDHNLVIVKRLAAAHQADSFTNFRPLSPELAAAAAAGVTSVFDRLGGRELLKSSGEVYVKPNAVESKAYVHVRPEVVEAVIRYWQAAGARRVYLMENSTQATFTRLVFEQCGYAKICRRTGAVPIFLDEEQTVLFPFSGKPAAATGAERGYDRTHFELSRTVADKLIEQRERNLYVSLPKLKTHSMGVVTLGIKNQWAFPRAAHRREDHNYNLHSKLVDVLSLVRPDVTLIEGVEGTIYGHFPPLALANESIKPFRVLIGGRNVVAVDTVGARMFGLTIEDVPHLKLAIERGLGEGVGSKNDIALEGDESDYDRLDLLGDLATYGGKYPWDLFPRFPPDVTVIQGRELACREGCVNNSLANLQIMFLDYQGQGGWTLLLGKGFDPDTIENLTGRILVAGPCAEKEVYEKLVKRLGKRSVYLSPECNNLVAVVESMCHLMKINPVRLAPINPLKGLALIIQSRLHSYHAEMANPLAHLIKLR